MHMNKGAGADKAEIEAEDNPETEESLEILDYWRDQVVQQLGWADAVFDLNKGRGAAWNRGENIFKNKIWKEIAFFYCDFDVGHNLKAEGLPQYPVDVAIPVPHHYQDGTIKWVSLSI